MNDVTAICNAMAQGDPRAASQLLPMVYDELRGLAARRLAQEPPGQTLEATALVHEVYLRLVGGDPAGAWEGRAHFFAAAAEAMRRILVENARRKGRLKRGGGQAREPVEVSALPAPDMRPSEELLSIDAAVDRLAAADPTAAELLSPEQAEMGAVDVDTRSDVYSLGVLLYELLTGSTPLEKGRLRQVAYADIIRQIREEEPPRPSTRLSESRDALPSLSAQRQTDPARLARMVRGDLDWIVMKALEKDRARRYESASGLARDVERHLAGDPIEAGPPSRARRLRKLARRHRSALLTAVAFAGLFLIFGAFALALAVRAARAAALERAVVEIARREAEQQRLAAEASEVRARAAQMFPRNDAVSSPHQGGEDRNADLAMILEELDASSSRIEQSLTGEPAKAASLHMSMGTAYSNLGHPSKAIPQFEKALALRRQALGHEHPDTLAAIEYLARALAAAGTGSRAELLWHQLLAIREMKTPDDWLTFYSRSMLGDALLFQKKFSEAEPLLLSGYEGMRVRKSSIPTPFQNRLAGAGFRIVELYETWGKKDKADEWRRKLVSSH